MSAKRKSVKGEPDFIYEKPQICEDREWSGKDSITAMRVAEAKPNVLANTLREMGVDCDYTGAEEEEE